jgi:hypothetical protein
MEQAFHPLSSPDPALSNFHLFSYRKDGLQGQHFKAEDQLFDAIMGLTGIMEKVTFQRVFLEEMERLRRCIGTNDEYVGRLN